MKRILRFCMKNGMNWLNVGFTGGPLKCKRNRTFELQDQEINLLREQHAILLLLICVVTVEGVENFARNWYK